MYRGPIITHLSQYCFGLIISICLMVFFFSNTTLQAEPKLEVRQTLEKTSVITGEELRGTVYLKIPEMNP